VDEGGAPFSAAGTDRGPLIRKRDHATHEPNVPP
jgi:hypothetical protein